MGGSGGVVEGGVEGGGVSKDWDWDGEGDSRGMGWVLYGLWEWVHGNVVLALLGGKERMSRRERGPADINAIVLPTTLSSHLTHINHRIRSRLIHHLISIIHSPPPPPLTLQILTTTNFSHPPFIPLLPTTSASHFPPPSHPLTPRITSSGLFCAHNNRNALPL